MSGNTINSGVGNVIVSDQNTNVGNVLNKDKTGSGVVGQTNQVPDVTELVLGYAAILSTLETMLPTIGSENMSVLMAEIAQKLKDTQMKSEEEKYKADTQTKRTELANKKDQLDEANKKLEDAEKDRLSGNIFAAIKAFFQMLGALIMAVVGAILMPFVPVAGALMIAGAVIMAMSTIDNIVKQATGGMGILGNIANAIAGGGEEGRKAAMYADMAFGIYLAVAGIAVGIAAAVAGNPQSLITAIKDIVNIGIQLSATAMDIGASVTNYQATEHQADAKKLQSDAKKIEGYMQVLDDAIDQALSRMMAAGDRFNAILDDIVETMNERGNTLARAKFTG